MLAEHGAKVVVNDFGGARDGTGGDAGPAEEVVAEITATGGEAVANSADVSDFAAAGALVQQAIDTFGGLDVVVSNAGILRDRMLFSMTEEEWDAVIRVHLKGTFAPARHAAQYWRDRAKAGETNDARLITTTSVSGLYGNPGQTNYGAAKAGIAAMTLIAADELGRYGVTANSIAPGALDAHDRGPRLPRRAPGEHGPALDRPDRHLAGLDRVGRRHRPGDRVDGLGHGDRRGLASRPVVGQAARRPRRRPRRPRAAAGRRSRPLGDERLRTPLTRGLRPRGPPKTLLRLGGRPGDRARCATSLRTHLPVARLLSGS